MRYSDFSKEVRFSYFLPYGIVSHHALVLAVYAGDDAYIEYIPGVPMQERVRICENAHMRRLRALRAMRDYGYIEEREKASGMEEWQNILFYKLTKAGLYFLTNNIDPALEEKRILNIRQDKSRKKRETGSYLPENLEVFEMGRELYNLAVEKPSNEQKRFKFESFLFKSANMFKSLLTTQPTLVQKARFTAPRTVFHHLKFYSFKDLYLQMKSYSRGSNRPPTNHRSRSVKSWSRPVLPASLSLRQ